MERIPNIVKNCKSLSKCYNGTKGDCRGCNIWNILYNHIDFLTWCIKMDKDPEVIESQMKEQYLE